MDYDTAVQALFRVMPEDAPPPVPDLSDRPARRLRDALEPVATHAVWGRATNEALAKLGLNFLTSYVWGRAAALGEPPAAVVVATFGVFEPNMVAFLYEEGRRACSRTELLETRDRASIASLSAILEGAELTGIVGPLRRAVEMAEGAGRPLFSGVRALGWPNDPVGQLWRACEALREHRGESHLAAAMSAGVEPVEMNILSELWLGMPLGSHTATWGWPEDAIAAAASRLEARNLVHGGGLTAAGRRLREDLEDHTDAQQQSVLDALARTSNRWSQRSTRHRPRASPPAPFRRTPTSGPAAEWS